jgi:hypothetical protein
MIAGSAIHVESKIDLLDILFWQDANLEGRTSGLPSKSNELFTHLVYHARNNSSGVRYEESSNEKGRLRTRPTYRLARIQINIFCLQGYIFCQHPVHVGNYYNTDR